MPPGGGASDDTQTRPWRRTAGRYARGGGRRTCPCARPAARRMRWGQRDHVERESSPSASGSAAAATWTAADLASVQTDSALTAALPSSIQSSGVIKCLSDIPYPPWEYFDPPDSTNPAGFDYDLSQALGKKIGVTVQFIDKPFDSRSCCSSRAATATCPCRACTTTPSVRRQGFSFVDYTIDGTGILVPKGNPNGITGLDSLAGKTVACENGTTQQAFLTEAQQGVRERRQGRRCRSSSLPGQPEALLAVKSDRAVARPHRLLDGAEHRRDHQQRQHVRGRQGPGGPLRPADGRHRHPDQEHAAASTPCRRRCRP